MQWLGEHQLPFGIIFTKADKLKANALDRNVATYKNELLETWEELPPLFITSSTNGEGREALLEYIDGINQQIYSSRPS
jgi:GTP-binding protein